MFICNFFNDKKNKFIDSEIINKCAKKKVKNFKTKSLVISNPNTS